MHSCAKRLLGILLTMTILGTSCSGSDPTPSSGDPIVDDGSQTTTPGRSAQEPSEPDPLVNSGDAPPGSDETIAPTTIAPDPNDIPPGADNSPTTSPTAPLPDPDDIPPGADVPDTPPPAPEDPPPGA